MSAEAFTPLWLGPQTYTEDDAPRFHGREAETAELLELISREQLILLHGESGHGKSSLLRAGLAPRLHEQGAFPIIPRDLFREDVPDLTATLLAAIGEQAAERGYHAPMSRSGDTLWEYFHRAGAYFTGPDRQSLVPVLILDQFEDLFRRCHWHPGEVDTPAARFLEELADLLNNREPAAVRERRPRREGDDFDHEPALLRVLIAMREDALPDLTPLHAQIPGLARKPYRLRELTREAALEVILRPVADSPAHAGLLGAAPAALARDILAGMAEGDRAQNGEAGDSVDPFLLSVVMDQLQRRAAAAGLGIITPALVETGVTDALNEFYEKAVAKVPERFRDWLEMHAGLVTKGGFRQSLASDDAEDESGDPDAIRHLRTLEDAHLLRAEQRPDRSLRFELVHDRLCPVLADKKRQREEESEKERARKERDALEQRAKEERKRSAKLKAALTAAILLLAFAIAACLVAYRSVLHARLAEVTALEQKGLADAAAQRADNSAKDAKQQEENAKLLSTQADAERTRALASAKEAGEQKEAAERNLRFAAKTAMETAGYARDLMESDPISDTLIANALAFARDNRVLSAMAINGLLENPKSSIDPRTMTLSGVMATGTPFDSTGSRLCIIDSAEHRLRLIDLTKPSASEEIPTGNQEVSVFHFIDRADIRWVAGTKDGAVLLSKGGAAPPVTFASVAGADGPILDLSLTKDSTELWTIQKSGTLLHRDLTSGRVISKPMTIGRAPLLTARFSRLSRHLVCIDADQTLRTVAPSGKITREVRAVSSGLPASNFARHTESFVFASLSAKGTTLHVVSDVAELTRDFTLSGVAQLSGRVDPLALTPMGDRLFTRNSEDVVQVWSLEKTSVRLQQNRTISAFKFSSSQRLAVSPDGLSVYAYSSSRDLSRRLLSSLMRWKPWPMGVHSDDTTDAGIPNFRARPDDLMSPDFPVTDIQIDPLDRWVAYGCENQSVIVCPTVATPIRDVPLYFEGEPPTWTAVEESVVVAANESEMTGYDIATGRTKWRQTSPLPIDHLTLSKDGKRLGLLSGGEKILWLDAASGLILLGNDVPRPPNSEGVQKIFFGPDIDQLYLEEERRIRTLSLTARNIVEPTFDLPEPPVEILDHAFAASGDVLWLAAASRLILFDRITGKLLLDHSDPALGMVVSVAIDQDRKYCAILNRKEALILYQLQASDAGWQLRARHEIQAGTNSGDSVFLDNRTLALVSDNFSTGMRLFDVKTLEETDAIEAFGRITEILPKDQTVTAIYTDTQDASGSRAVIGRLTSMILKENPRRATGAEAVPAWFPTFVQEVFSGNVAKGGNKPRSLEERSRELRNLREIAKRTPDSYYTKAADWFLSDPRTRNVLPSFDLPACDLIARMVARALAISVPKISTEDLSELRKIADDIHAQDSCHPLTHLVVARLCEASGVYQQMNRGTTEDTTIRNAEFFRAHSLRLFGDSFTAELYGKERLRKYAEIAVEGLTLESERKTREAITTILTDLGR